MYFHLTARTHDSKSLQGVYSLVPRLFLVRGNEPGYKARVCMPHPPYVYYHMVFQCIRVSHLMNIISGCRSKNLTSINTCLNNCLLPRSCTPSYSQYYVHIAENRTRWSWAERVCGDHVTSSLSQEGPGITQK